MARSMFKVTGMHCGSCGMLIDDAVEELPGVESSETDVRKGSTTVVHDESLSQKAIVEAIVAVGYSAEPAAV
ncbi:MAG: heavy-metal-associated domain-containing protein [Actinomycetota bacterium]